MDGDDAGAPSGRIAARTVATLALAMLLGSLGTSIANIALPTLAEAFAAPFAAVQAVVVAYLAALTVAVVIAGRLGDRYGLKPMLVAGLGLFALASLFCALAPSLPLLIAARALQGSGAAFLMTLSMALMRQTASPARLGRVMGLLGTVSALGTALGPVLGGLLIPVAGWRGIFAVLVPLALLALVLAIAMPPGAAARESRASSPPGVAVIRGLVPNLLVNLLVAAVMMTTLVVGPFYLGIALGLTATQVGLVMAVGPAISVISGVPSGRLVDAGGPFLVGAVGLGLLAGGAFLLALLPNLVGVTGYVLATAVVTPGYQLFQAANNTAALADVPPDRRGTVAGLLNLSRNIGLIAGASVMGAVFAFGVGTDAFARATPTAIAAGMQLTFLLAGALMLVAIGLVAGARRGAADRG
ncbi:MFS transporter [Ancylobacter sp. WKF20]|uniref:MFS transporter n=1 Tax=Ancylobacter sp. WKF20 TaxID=3039801 RepID=UPI0024344CD2|nr:MFS transporter [Ancylobacter sp. WKF20]WGD32301.1 MFS transporter [Ancylobacter sp. WKF20]